MDWALINHDIKVVVWIGVPSTLEELIQQFGKLTEMEELQEVQVCSTNKKGIALMMGSLDPISITACTTYLFGHLLHALH